MTDRMPQPNAFKPRWDGRRILFEIADGDHQAPCTISVNALQDLSGQRRFKPSDLLACFASAQPKIEAIALAKLRGRNASTTGLLYIWSDDIDEPPPDSTPAVAEKAKALRVA
jgi:hypothetical protein